MWIYTRIRHSQKQPQQPQHTTTHNNTQQHTTTTQQHTTTHNNTQQQHESLLLVLFNSLLSGTRSLLLDPVILLLMMTLLLFWELGIGEFHHVFSGLHRRLSDFIHSVVVHRRDDAVRGWRNWIREDPLIHLYKWLRPDLVPPAPFLQCKPHLTLGGSGVLSDPARIDEEFRKAWLPYFCRSGQRETSLEEFVHEVEGWLPLLLEISLPRLIGRMLADVVQRKSATAGSLDGWGWRELKVLLVSWYDELARILSSKVEDLGVWPDGLLDAYIAMIPKTDGDSTRLGQRPLSVLPIVYRVWASARMGQLDGLVQVLGT